MHYKYLISIFSFLFLFQLGVLSQSSKKDVYLLPGLGSNTYQWNVYNNYIATNYSSKSTVRTDGYVLDASSTLGSIDSQFTILYNNFSDRNFKNIVIGQSLGGIMAQGIAAKYNSSGSLPGFGGIITCGSPNNGVPLFNNWEAAKNFAQSGIINANNVYNSVSRFENQVIGRDILNNNFDYRQYFVLVKKYLDSFKKNVMDIDVNVSAFVRDILKPSSTLISALKSTPNNLNRYKIAIYGNESSPIPIRLIASGLIDPVWNKPLNENSDDAFVRTLTIGQNFIRGVYDNIAYFNTLIAVLFPLPSLFTSLLGDFDDVVTDFFRLSQFVSNSEASWSSLIGATETVMEARWVRVRNPACNPRRIQSLNSNTSYYLPSTCPGVEPFIYVLQYFPVTRVMASDGFFPASSQQFTTINNYTVNVEALKVNHAEFFNHVNMTRRFEQILGGTSPEYADGFNYTNLRNHYNLTLNPAP